MANKTGVVRKGRTVSRGEKKGDSNTVKNYGPGEEVTVPEDEYDRLMKIGAIAKPGSGEAQVAKVAADELPGDFPGVEALRKAEITTFSQLEDVDDLTAIKGIGEATAAEIEDALEAREG